jgi:hypothetical protein
MICSTTPVMAGTSAAIEIGGISRNRRPALPRSWIWSASIGGSQRRMGLNHEDTGHRPELPPGRPAVHPDARLLELEKKIFKHKEAFDALQPEVDRLNDIYNGENRRLHDEFEATRMGPTFEERMAIVHAMPEFKEYMRLREL